MRPVALALVLTSAVLAQKVVAPPDAASQVDHIFAVFNQPDSPGCAVGASIDGKTVLSAGYGMADLEHNVRITPQSVFEAGSVSKQFTAAAVLLLAQQGKLSLDDPVRKYLPEVPDYGTPVTIRQMLHHISGLRDWGSVEAIAGWPRTTRMYTMANVLEIVSQQRALNYPPGAAYSYSNTGFNLAAMIVARVSGRPFPQFTRDAIFNPLDMSSTQWRDDYQRIVPNRAIAYTKDHGTVRMLMPFEDAYGNGGLLTTVGDLLRWNRNFTEGKIGGPGLVKEQEQRVQLNDGRTIAYASGLMILSWHGLREVSHSGSTAGYRAWLGRYPDQGLSVAVLCNLASANDTQLGHRVADVYLGDAGTKKLAPAQLDEAALEARAGLYRSVRDHEVIAVEIKDGSPHIASGGIPEFETDAAGNVVRLRIPNEVDGGDYYEKVEPWHPAAAELESMTGAYSSAEADVVFQVALEKGRLVLHRHPDAVFPLKPTYRNAFSSALGSIRFIQDREGHVIEMSMGEQRVWDLRLRRLP